MALFAAPRLRDWAKLGALMLALGATAASAPSADSGISGTTVDGRAFSSKDERGHVMLVNFWATWCGPCRAELPALDVFYRMHHDEGVDMLAISLDDGLSRQALAKAVSRFSFPVARIADIDALPRPAPVTLPVTWVYARDGSLRYDSAVQPKKIMDADTLDAIVVPLLTKTPRVQ